MENSIDDIQKLRELTGAGVMDCRRAIQESGGDFDQAVNIIREKGLLKVEKRSGRETGAGLIESYIHNGRIGVLLDLRAETDFVVRSGPFRELAHELVMQIAAAAPEDIEQLLEQPHIKDESKIIKNLVNETIAKVGENIKINKFFRMEI